ncbi:MAG: hypothetical protein ACRCTP_02305 [Aeromonas popoffii]|uniref:hypothetical protein n=1 Tax=Aeromonas popoffii TaxID=70856 RepID=UPI003F3AB9B1
MAAPMTYDVILREQGNPKDMLKYPLADTQSVCFFRLSYGFEDVDDEWVENARCPVLDSLVYYFNEDLMKADEVKAVMSCLFDNCEYGVQWEVSPCEVINDCDHQMFLTGFDAMPRGLFMNKMFCIRNLIRDEESFNAHKALLEGGVPLNIAAYLGGALETKTSWNGDQYTCIKEYAGYINPGEGAFAQIIRGMSSNIYCEQESPPWDDGYGYNHRKDNGRLPDGSWAPMATQICSSVAKYQGDNLPTNWDNGSLYEMSDAQVTTLIRFICNNDELTYSTQKES